MLGTASILDIPIKKLVDHAVIPQPATDGSAGLDLVATDYYYNQELDYHEFGTGLAISIPRGYVGLIFPRSSITKTGMTLGNSVGVIDSDYRGEITFRFRVVNNDLDTYTVGDRVGQLVIVPFNRANFLEVEEFGGSTNRGVGGYGSTGR